MSLKLGTFPVERVEVGPKTAWRNGVLTINRRELQEVIRSDPKVAQGDVDITSPGESCRIIHVSDVLEPRVKVEGSGTTYPGICGRPVETVGSGVTHRLGGLAVVESSLNQRGAAVRTMTAEEALSLPQNARPQDFIDMSGPGAVTPAAALHNVVVVVDAQPGITGEDQYLVTHSAALRVADRLAQAVADQNPPQVEIVDTAVRGAGLPGVVFNCNLMSMEHWTGPDSKMGTAVYGVTRLSAPWVLSPAEMLDGAVSQRVSWHFTNNPIVRQLLDRHGKELNFFACIIQRTNWGGQREMQLSANRSAQVASLLGAQGAIVTTNIRGRRFVDTVLGITAYESSGIKTVLVTEEEDDEDGSAPPLLVYTPEMQSIVSTGAGAAGPFHPTERVIGGREGDDAWSGELPMIAGRYGAFHLQDYYGYGRQSRDDY